MLIADVEKAFPCRITIYDIVGGVIIPPCGIEHVGTKTPNSS